MRILMIGQKGIPAQYGGIERHVEELAVELTKKGNEVFVYSRFWYTSPTIKEWRGIKVIHTPTIYTKHLDTIIHTFVSTVHALFQKPDIIHYHGVGPSLLSWIPRIFLPHTKVVATFHCVDRYHQKWGVFARLMLRLGEFAACLFPHVTIAVSRSIKNYCLNEYKKETVYIPNGARKISFSNPALLKQFNLEEKKYVAMISRLVPHKGAHYLIAAWQKIKKICPDLIKGYKLAIVGDSAFTDSYVAGLKKFANKDTDIVFTSWVQGKTLDTIFKEAALLVHPSENEGLPLTVLSGMSAGTPILVSNISEHQELIEDKNFVFANTDVDDLTQKMINILKNPALRESASIVNKKQAQEIYSWEKIGDQTEKVYMDLLPLPAKQVTTKIA
jgi:glycosyltransferase involved in cell wall biosynthesis